MDEYASLSGAIGLPQARLIEEEESFLTRVAPDTVAEEYEPLRFWGLLNAAERRTLLKGGKLLAGSMGESARRAAVAVGTDPFLSVGQEAVRALGEGWLVAAETGVDYEEPYYALSLDPLGAPTDVVPDVNRRRPGIAFEVRQTEGTARIFVLSLEEAAKR